MYLEELWPKISGSREQPRPVPRLLPRLETLDDALAAPQPIVKLLHNRDMICQKKIRQNYIICWLRLCFNCKLQKYKIGNKPINAMQLINLHLPLHWHFHKVEYNLHFRNNYKKKSITNLWIKHKDPRILDW